MTEGLFIIAITSPDDIPDEAMRICRILESGDADMVHIRKPEWDYGRTRSLIERIPFSFYDRIKLHDHFEIVKELGLCGIHLNSRNPEPTPGAKSVSRSFHSIDQLDMAKHYDYVTLSPIFDSISKIGYKSSFNLAELKEKLEDKRVIALGGVTPEKFPLIKDTGFFGAAMLGYFWRGI